MNFQKLLMAALLALNAAAASAGQSEISSKLGRMAENLVAAYGKTPGAVQKPKAAILTFNGSKELEKRRIGFAVSEILSHKISEKGAFVLLERTELNRVFDELKLNMSGVTSQDDALKAGKLASADLLVLGSVEKFGAMYHINSRLVKAETGEVLASGYEELPVSVFEKEAREYVVLVPKSQAIGIYFLYNYRLTKGAPTVSTTRNETCNGNPCTYNSTSSGKKAQLGLIGLGVRYAPAEKLLVDLSFTTAETGRTTLKVRRHDSFFGGYVSDWVDNYNQKFTLLRGVVGITSRPGKVFSYFLGGGATSIMMYGDGNATYLTPTLLARAEYHPQERIGISLAAGYDFTTKNATTEDWVLGKIKTARLEHFYLEPTISIYF